MTFPPVTVICLCHNQGRFVKEAIRSVVDQTYPNIQLLVVDDASTDDSVDVIREIAALHPRIEFFPLSRNVGNCKAFNHALRHATGDYIIDLAADDILLPERVGKGVLALWEAGDIFGVNFTNADWIAENGIHLYSHSVRFPHATIPQGNIYKELIARFFICSPSMMFRRSVLDALGGYDEDLAYEDFDFWIRSSRNFYYCYTPEVLVKKRVVKHSMSQKQFAFFSPQLQSTFRVCEKIMALNRNHAEQKALGKRILYEMRLSLRWLHFSLAKEYVKLYFINRRLRYRC
jgi:glycosyltransferase involved in cell wall biosynthesis